MRSTILDFMSRQVLEMQAKSAGEIKTCGTCHTTMTAGKDGKITCPVCEQYEKE